MKIDKDVPIPKVLRGALTEAGETARRMVAGDSVFFTDKAAAKRFQGNLHQLNKGTNFGARIAPVKEGKQSGWRVWRVERVTRKKKGPK